jgi:hypothetical protein
MFLSKVEAPALAQYRSVKEDVFNCATKGSSILSSRGKAEGSAFSCTLNNIADQEESRSLASLEMTKFVLALVDSRTLNGTVLG